MAHFAKLDENNTVIEVVAVSNSDAPDETSGVAFLLSLFGQGNWKQCSYHGTIRKNYPGMGYTYDAERDAFIPPKPDDAIGFDEETCWWIVPQGSPL